MVVLTITQAHRGVQGAAAVIYNLAVQGIRLTQVHHKEIPAEQVQLALTRGAVAAVVLLLLVLLALVLMRLALAVLEAQVYYQLLQVRQARPMLAEAAEAVLLGVILALILELVVLEAGELEMVRQAQQI
jgi:hypothetical protein